MAPRFEPRANMEDLEASFLDKKKKESTKWKDGVFYYTLCSAHALAFCIALVLSFSLFNSLSLYIYTLCTTFLLFLCDSILCNDSFYVLWMIKVD